MSKTKAKHINNNVPVKKPVICIIWLMPTRNRVLLQLFYKRLTFLLLNFKYVIYSDV